MGQRDERKGRKHKPGFERISLAAIRILSRLETSLPQKETKDDGVDEKPCFEQMEDHARAPEIGAPSEDSAPVWEDSAGRGAWKIST